MILEGFYFGTEDSRDNGLMIAYAETSPSNSIAMGSELTSENFYNSLNYTTTPLRYKYESPVSCTFDILKSDCKTRKNKFFNAQEISHIMRWLNTPRVQKFIPIYDDIGYDDVYFMGTFTNITMINRTGECEGFTVTFTATSPWGYAAEITDIRSSSTSNWQFNIVSDSDNYGYLYPASVKVKCLADGILELKNNAETETDRNDNNNIRKTRIRNCKNGEVITFDCEHQIVQSSIDHPTLYNDFNWNFPRLITTSIYNEDNVFTVSIPCEVEFKYSPIRKVGILV